MGSKVHPEIFRIKVIYNWKSRWFSKKPGDFADFLRQDVGIRKLIKKKMRDSGIARVEIDRLANNITITIYTSRPGLVISRGGKSVNDLKNEIAKIIDKKNIIVNINIKEVKRPQWSSEIMLENIIADLEKRIPFRRAAKQVMSQIEKAGAKGAKVTIAGRLNGAEIARTEKFTFGKIPLQTLRADIDYARGTAHTTYGTIGVKVWIYKGDIFGQNLNKEE